MEAFISNPNRVGHAKSASEGNGFESDYAKLPTVAKQAILIMPARPSTRARNSAKNQRQVPY